MKKRHILARRMFAAAALAGLGWTGAAFAQDLIIPEAPPMAVPMPMPKQDVPEVTQVPSQNKSMPAPMQEVAPVPEQKTPMKGNDDVIVEPGSELPNTVPMEMATSPYVVNETSFAPSAQGGHLTGGIGLYFIQPTFESNPAYGVSVSNTGAPFKESVTQHQFRYNTDLAPEVWLGIVSDSGMGLRVRYFGYAQGANESVVSSTFPAGTTATVFSANPLDQGRFSTRLDIPGNSANFSSDLNVNVWDFEVSQDWNGGAWQLQGTAGIRYAHMSQRYDASGDLSGGDSFILRSGHNFNGAGPTASVDGKYRVGDSGLAVYGKARGSLVFGTTKETATGTFFTSGVVDESREGNSRNTDCMPIVESELGVEFGRDFSGKHLFVQTGLATQTWFGAGNASNNSSIFTSGVDNSSNLGFVGVTLRAGIDF